MKKRILIILSSGLFFLTGCVDLNLNPLYEGSSENWFSDDNEFLMAVNEFYRLKYWYVETRRFNNTDRWTDDWNQRDAMYDWLQGNFTSDFGEVRDLWSRLYAGVTRTNTVLSNVHEKRGKGVIPEGYLDIYEGESLFFRACFYNYLVFLWGDVPFYTEYLYLDDAYQMSRTDKSIVMKQVYEDFDRAAELLPVSYPTSFSDLQRITKGMVYGMKARAALWQSDWATAASMAKECIDLGVYSLHPSFRTLFLSSTRTSPEHILVLPRSKEIMGDQYATKSRLPRNNGGQATAQPSWELMCSYIDTDGNPIDKSSKYDPKNPFQNRDPRMAETMVELGTEFLGFIWSPGTKTTTTSAGQTITNKDSRINQTYASFNGMTLKKGVDETWLTALEEDNNIVVLRYADLLLMYAEAKIELNQIDDTVLEAINLVRERAYNGTGLTYPKVTETDQAKLRTILRTERRMELACENRRWFALIRWRLAEISLVRPIYCHPQGAELEELVKSDDYFFPSALPVIDENGLVDLSPVYATGKIMIINQRGFQMRQYLMPIPAIEIEVCPNIVQNEGY